jgi:hypothetical protein
MGRLQLYTVFILASSLLSLKGVSQKMVTVHASSDKKEILIGDPIQLTLEAKTSLGLHISWFPLDTIPHFEFIEKGKIDSVVTATEKTYTQHLTITSFDSGRHSIIPMPFKADGKLYYTDSIPVSINYSKMDPKQDYHDIKDIIDVPNPYAKYIAWTVALVTLAAIVLVVLFINKKRIEKREEQITVSKLSPYDEAVAALQELGKQELLKKGEVKQYYTRLHDIFRVFVFRKWQMNVLDKTSEELILQLKKVDMPYPQFTKLSQSLRMGDFVKFAKYVPAEQESLENFNVIQSSIDVLNEIEK